MYPNNRIGFPFGDAFIVGTPALDKLSDRLYAEQKQREAQQQRDAKMLDDEFAKNMAGIRDADIPDLTKAYGEYKLANMQGIKNKNITPEQQLDILRKKANVYDVISKSKAQREQEKAYGADIMKNPNRYIRDAHGKLIEVFKTPVSQIGDNDVFGGLKYQGNVTSFQPLLQKAAGKVIDMEDEIVDNPKQLQKDVTKVKRLNNANEYFDSLRSGIVGSQGADDFLRTFGNISPEAYQLTEQQYNQMMADPVMKKRFGNPPDLPPTEELTDIEKAAKYMAMQHALINHPITEVGKSIPDYVARKEDAFNKELYKMRLRHGWQNDRDKQQQEYRVALKYGLENKWLEDTFKDIEKTPTGVLYDKKANGTEEEVKVFPASSKFLKVFEKDGMVPDQVVQYKDGHLEGWIYQRYSAADEKKDKTHKEGEIIKEANGNIPRATSIIPVKLPRKAAMIEYGKTLTSGNDLTDELGTETQTKNPTEIRISGKSSSSKKKYNPATGKFE